VVLSDRTIRRLIAEERIGIDPFDPDLMQPSSLDVRVDRYFRVFRNSRYPYIDVKTSTSSVSSSCGVLTSM
jgi:dCTP deaminase